MTGYQGDPLLVTIPRAVPLLGISARTGYDLARKGKFPGDAAIQVGKSWRVSLPKLRRYLGADPDGVVTAQSDTSQVRSPTEAAAKVRRLLEALVDVLGDPTVGDVLGRAVVGGGTERAAALDSGFIPRKPTTRRR